MAEETTNPAEPSAAAMRAARRIVTFVDSAVGMNDQDGEAVIVAHIARIIDSEIATTLSS